MILVTITYGGNKYRYSMINRVLEHQWHGVIKNIRPITVRVSTYHGGLLKVTAGRITFVPEIFGDKAWSIPAWPPPAELSVSVSYTDTTEAAAIPLFNGKLALVSFDEKTVEYTPYIESYTMQVSSGTNLGAYGATNSLLDFMGAAATALGLNFNGSTVAPVPSISHTTSTKQLLIDIVDQVAAYFSHVVWISGGTLFLRDMEYENGTLNLISMNDYLRGVMYNRDLPVNDVSAGSVQYFGTEYPYGVSYSLGSSFNNDEGYLATVYGYMNKQQISLPVPAESVMGEFAVGKTVVFYDGRLPVESSCAMYIRGMEYDAMNYQVTLFGDGIVSEMTV
jgi:hypothetical protein